MGYSEPQEPIENTGAVTSANPPFVASAYNFQLKLRFEDLSIVGGNY